MSRRTFGAFLIAVGLLGLAGAAVVGVGGWLLVGGAERTLGDTLEVAADGVGIAADTVGVVDTTVDRFDGSLTAVESGLEGAGRAFSELEPVVGELGALAGREVPAVIEALDGTAAALGAVAGGVDSALGALSLFGVDYEPAADLSESLRDIDASLDGVPERLRAQSGALERAGADLAAVGADVRALAAEVAAARVGLADATALVGRYERAAADATAVVAAARRDLDRQVAVGRIVVVAAAGVLALTQVVPITLGLRLRRRATGAG